MTDIHPDILAAAQAYTAEHNIDPEIRTAVEHAFAAGWRAARAECAAAVDGVTQGQRAAKDRFVRAVDEVPT